MELFITKHNTEQMVGTTDNYHHVYVKFIEDILSSNLGS